MVNLYFYSQKDLTATCGSVWSVHKQIKVLESLKRCRRPPSLCLSNLSSLGENHTVNFFSTGLRIHFITSVRYVEMSSILCSGRFRNILKAFKQVDKMEKTN